jgi:TonB family protein
VVLNAAHFLYLYFGSFARDPQQAEQWIKRACELDPGDHIWSERLAMYYSRALKEVARGDTTGANPTFAEHARAELESSSDGFLLWRAGSLLANSRAAQDPQLRELYELGKRLQRRSEELGFHSFQGPRVRDLAAAAAARRQEDLGPRPIKREDPAYPPLASHARIQGTVRLRLLVSRAGSVLQTEVISGHPLLVKAAQDAVKRWMYAPQPMETFVEVEVPFRLTAWSPAAQN